VGFDKDFTVGYPIEQKSCGNSSWYTYSH